MQTLLIDAADAAVTEARSPSTILVVVHILRRGKKKRRDRKKESRKLLAKRMDNLVRRMNIRMEIEGVYMLPPKLLAVLCGLTSDCFKTINGFNQSRACVLWG